MFELWCYQSLQSKRLGSSLLKHSFLTDHKPKPFKVQRGYRRTVRLVHVLLLLLSLEIAFESIKPRSYYGPVIQVGAHMSVVFFIMVLSP